MLIGDAKSILDTAGDLPCFSISLPRLKKKSLLFPLKLHQVISDQEELFFRLLQKFKKPKPRNNNRVAVKRMVDRDTHDDSHRGHFIAKREKNACNID